MALNDSGNDLTATNRMNAAADQMKADRLGTPDPATATPSFMILNIGNDPAQSGSLFQSLPGAMGTPAGRTDNRTWGDFNAQPAIGQVEDVTKIGGNF